MSGELNEELFRLRKEYSQEKLLESGIFADPLHQFALWMEEAGKAGVNEPHAMVLATVSAELNPSQRVVLLRNVSPEGFSFYTNYQSRKGAEISQNNHAALCFFWAELERQIRIEGIIEKLSEEESDRYFASRPRESQIGAWASPQSSRVANREFLEEKYRETEKHFENKAVTRPPHWGGFRLIPQRIEFWQGRPGRLHDRILFEKIDDFWSIHRLAP